MGKRSRIFGFLGVSVLAFGASGCFGDVPPIPTVGYGAPYRGTGKPIYVKDSRTDWSITEGDKPITSEQALEATNDPEYEARRQIARDYNKQLFAEGETHQTYGYITIGSGLAATIGGIAIAAFLPNPLRETSTTAATSTAPEERNTKAGFASNAASIGGVVLAVIGVGMIVYGYRGGKEPPPYHVWKTPDPLHRPAYLRQLTEPYNEKIGAPPVAFQPGSVESVAGLAPGQRAAPPPRPGATPPPPPNGDTAQPNQPFPRPAPPTPKGTR